MDINTSNATKTAKDTYNGAAKTVDKFADKFADKAQSGLEHVADRARDLEPTLANRYEAIRDTASEGYDTAVSAVKKYPLYAVLGATSIGLMAGLLLARRKN